MLVFRFGTGIDKQSTLTAVAGKVWTMPALTSDMVTGSPAPRQGVVKQSTEPAVAGKVWMVPALTSDMVTVSSAPWHRNSYAGNGDSSGQETVDDAGADQ